MSPRKYRDPGQAIEASWSRPGGGTLYQGRDAAGEFWTLDKEEKKREVEYHYTPTACYCNALGHMAPCSWCTDPERTEEDFNPPSRRPQS